MNARRLALEAHLEMATRHVVDGERLVTEQKELLKRLKDHNYPTEQAEKFLEILRTILDGMSEHKALIERELADCASASVETKKR